MAQDPRSSQPAGKQDPSQQSCVGTPWQCQEPPPLRVCLLGGRPQGSPVLGPKLPIPAHSASTPRGTRCFCLGFFPKHRPGPGEGVSESSREQPARSWGGEPGDLRPGEAGAGVSLVFWKQTDKRALAKASQENPLGLGVGWAQTGSEAGQARRKATEGTRDASVPSGGDPPVPSRGRPPTPSIGSPLDAQRSAMGVGVGSPRRQDLRVGPHLPPPRWVLGACLSWHTWPDPKIKYLVSRADGLEMQILLFCFQQTVHSGLPEPCRLPAETPSVPCPWRVRARPGPCQCGECGRDPQLRNGSGNGGWLWAAPRGPSHDP